MSKIETTPILIKIGSQKIRIMNITYEKEDSIYFTFPRKKGYLLDKISISKYSGKEEDTIHLEPVDTYFESPKISFHPRDFTMHIRTPDKHVTEDFELFNFSGDKSMFFTFFMQIILPSDLSLFDIYDKTKYQNILEIEELNNDAERYSIEIIIHDNRTMATEECLPYSKNRKLKGSATYVGTKDYSCSIFISTIPLGFQDKNIFCLINTKMDKVAFNLEPKQ